MEEEDIYTPSGNLAVDAERARLPAMRRFKLVNPEDFTEFEFQTMGAISRLAVAVANVNMGNLASDEPTPKIALDTLGLMNDAFPRAHWTVVDE